jgi:uncharacterized protein involved in exopolysaccharide biosynthesis
VDRNGAIGRGLASRASESLKQEMDAAKARLDAQERAIVEFAARNAGALPAQMTAVTSKYARLAARLQATAVEMAQTRDRRDALESALAAAGPPAEVGEPAARLTQAQSELTALGARFTEQSLEVRSKQAEIASLEALVAASQPAAGGGPRAAIVPGASMVVTLRSQVADASARLKVLQTRNAGIQDELLRFERILQRAPTQNAELNRISHDVTPTRTRYESLRSRYDQARAAERTRLGQHGMEFQVLEAATPAQVRLAPNRKILLGFALLLAVGCGLGAVLLADRLDSSFRTVDELRAFTHVPVLATIPRTLSQEARRRQSVTAVLAGAAASLVLALVSFGLFHLVQDADRITRTLVR